MATNRTGGAPKSTADHKTERRVALQAEAVKLSIKIAEACRTLEAASLRLRAVHAEQDAL